jgi:hypothetical protein
MLATHGVQPYIIADRLYDPDDTYGLNVDDFFSWGASLCSGCLDSAPGYAQRNTFEVGPGFRSTDGRTRDPESGGAFYSRGWDRAIGHGNHIVSIDTFNYWVEGSGIGPTREYGRQFLNITQAKAQTFKQKKYSSASQVKVTLGGSNTSEGLYQDEVQGATTTPDGRGGRRAVGRSMYFAVDDSFLLDCAPATTTYVFDVDYLPEGVGIFDIKQVDANGQEQTLKRINVPDRTSGHFEVQGLCARNRLQSANDLRIDTDTTNALVIKSITITRNGPPPCPDPSSASGPGLPALAAGWNRTFVPIAARNTCASPSP